MLEYPNDEAIELLKNLASAEKNLTEICADINYLRKQLNTTDFSLSRVNIHYVRSARNAASKLKATRAASS